MRNSSETVQVKAKKNEFTYKHAEIGHLKMYAVVAENKWFSNEEAFLPRRILICLATICEQFPEFCSMLFRSHCDNAESNESFLEILSSTLKNIWNHVRKELLMILKNF